MVSEKIFQRMADHQADTGSLTSAMKAFVSLLWQISGNIGKKQDPEAAVQRKIALVFGRHSEWQDPFCPLGQNMAFAVVFECVSRDPFTLMGLKPPEEAKDRDCLPVFRGRYLKRLVRSLNLIGIELNLFGIGNWPFRVLAMELGRYIWNVCGTYDLVSRTDRDVPGGLAGYHVERLVHSMVGSSELTASLVHRAIGACIPARSDGRLECERFLTRFDRARVQGLRMSPRRSSEGFIYPDELRGPARFSFESMKDARFVAMAEQALEHLVPGLGEPDWIGYEPSYDPDSTEDSDEEDEGGLLL